MRRNPSNIWLPIMSGNAYIHSVGTKEDEEGSLTVGSSCGNSFLNVCT